MKKFDPQLLIFDLDGTLVDTRRDLANAVNYALQQVDIESISFEQIVEYVGSGISKLIERVLRRSEGKEFERMLKLFRKYYAEHLTDYSELYPGMLEVLDYFRDRQLAVLSNKPQEFVDPIVERLGIRERFEIVIGGRPNLKLKPDPEAIHFILNQLKIEPSNALMIGDGETDVLAGQAAGIKTCAVTYGFRKAEQLLPLKPNFVVHRAIDLKRFEQFISPRP